MLRSPRAACVVSSLLVLIAVIMCCASFSLKSFVSENAPLFTLRSRRQVICGGRFKCESGQCVDFDQVCNGAPDCIDSSDETEKLCQQYKCPTRSFKCKYGACVRDDAICDGKVDCIDKSDENVRGCTTSSKCLSDEFQCDSGQCISKSLVCDGKVDCVDDPGSDETDKECKQIRCPENSFRCSYGACINQDSKCDGKIQCADSSDESPNLCRISKPTPLAVTQEEGCVMPEKPEHGNFFVNGCEIGDDSSICQKIPGTLVTKPLSLTYICNNGYTAMAGNEAVCDKGKWSSSFPKCIPACGIRDTLTFIGTIYENLSRVAEVPWHSSIYRYEGGKHVYICGGTLISHNLVVTAAHCVWNISSKTTLAKENIKIGFGKYFSNYYSPDPGAQFAEPGDIKIHPNYYGMDTFYENDIALIVLKTALESTWAVKPICVDWSNELQFELPGHFGLIGLWNPTKEKTDTIHIEHIPVVETRKCKATVPDEFRKYVTWDKICAGFENGTNVCVGNSGAGLTYEKNGIWYVVGIASSGGKVTKEGCSSSYTFLSSFFSHLNFLRSGF